MAMTLTQSLGPICTGGAAWLMVRAGAAKQLLQQRAERHCAACGRRLGRGPCACSHDS